MSFTKSERPFFPGHRRITENDSKINPRDIIRQFQKIFESRYRVKNVVGKLHL